MKLTISILLCLSYGNLLSQKDDLPFRIYLVEPRAKCVSLEQLSQITKLRITDTAITIVSFECGFFTASDTLILENKGAEFQAKFLHCFKVAKDGDMIYITGVKVILPGGKYSRTLAEQIVLIVGCKKEQD